MKLPAPMHGLRRVTQVALASTALLAVAAQAQTGTPPTTDPARPGSVVPDAATSPGEPAAVSGTEAQQAAEPTAPASAAQAGAGEGGLQEIVVTAQRREQRLQDVPIAITAITQDTIQANRVFNVNDLSGLAPNVQVRASAGGTGIPSFSMRGVVSYGVVPGSDKSVSIYVDGVYIGNSRGAIFELPDIARIEVLRGPQGTLFGRNATAGAVSIVTRDPTGEFAVRQELSYGNYDQFRTRTSIDLPQVGPFSGYVTFVHNQRDGDIRNTGAGTSWTRTSARTDLGTQISPRRLGDRNNETYFAALRFEPSDSFTNTYKFDLAVEENTPEGTAVVGVNPASPLIGNLLTSLINSQATPVQFASDAKRPKSVNNWWATPGRQRNIGHSLTSQLRITDNLSLKNIASYRKSTQSSASQIDGLGGLTFTPQALVPYATFVTFSRNPGLATAPAATQAAAIGAAARALAPLVGGRFNAIVTNNFTRHRQWSDELQANYSSDLLDLTVGALYYEQKSIAGGPRDFTNTFNFTVFPASGVIAPGNVAESRNKAISYAAYAQAEVHLTDQIDAVGGFRLTRDKKSGTFESGGTYDAATGTLVGTTISPFTYRDTQPSYSAGINYKPNADVLVYGKYGFSYVSGGAIGNIPFANETARAWEAGIKADLLDRRLRANLALFTVKYRNLQNAQSGQNVGRPDLGTVLLSQGNNRSKGAELELTALPVRGLTLNGSVGYTDVKFGPVNPILIASVGGGEFLPTLIPKWSGNLAAQYETEPLFGDARGFFRVDATWRSKMRTGAGPDRAAAIPAFALTEFSPRAWVVNSRVALRDIDFGPVKGEIAAWGRNLNNNRATTFPLGLGNFLTSASFQPARTYGVDLILAF